MLWMSLALGADPAPESTRMPGMKEGEMLAIAAARDLYPGVVVSQEDLMAIVTPVSIVPQNVATRPSWVLGKRPVERILANEFIRMELFPDPEAATGLPEVPIRTSDRLKTGSRGIRIGTDHLVGAAVVLLGPDGCVAANATVIETGPRGAVAVPHTSLLQVFASEPVTVALPKPGRPACSL